MKFQFLGDKLLKHPWHGKKTGTAVYSSFFVPKYTCRSFLQLSSRDLEQKMHKIRPKQAV